MKFFVDELFLIIYYYCLGALFNFRSGPQYSQRRHCVRVSSLTGRMSLVPLESLETYLQPVHSQVTQISIIILIFSQHHYGNSLQVLSIRHGRYILKIILSKVDTTNFQFKDNTRNGMDKSLNQYKAAKNHPTQLLNKNKKHNFILNHNKMK